MLGLDDYGSDSDTSPPGSPKAPAKVVKPVSHIPKKPQKAPKKFSIALPAPKEVNAGEDEREDDRPAKKRKTGAGVSSLLSMLPTPKSSNPLPTPQRVLGSGAGPGLKFRTQTSNEVFVAPKIDMEKEEFTTELIPPEPSDPISATLFRPTSVAKGRKNISVEEHNINQTTAKPSSAPAKPVSSAPAIDFFSLGSTTTAKNVSSTSTPTSISISSAPAIPVFEPPEPTPTDPYPGYYQLPSGAWAAHDAEYYATFMKKWQKEYDNHVKSLEKGGGKGFEDFEGSTIGEVDAQKEMERAKREIQEREEKKAITMGGDDTSAAPRMTMTASKMSGIARSRHQLSTLLREAYENRDALEERIAQGKRNRKEAGNKYGF